MQKKIIHTETDLIKLIDEREPFAPVLITPKAKKIESSPDRTSFPSFQDYVKAVPLYITPVNKAVFNKTLLRPAYKNFLADNKKTNNYFGIKKLFVLVKNFINFIKEFFTGIGR